MLDQDIPRYLNHNESGAALITVVMIAALLSIATIGILSGVGSNSQNSTDVLAETKAYYAAESGLQSTIKVLRHNSPAVSYSVATADPNLRTWLNYNCDISDSDPANDKVSIGPDPCDPYAGTGYYVTVSDPDNTGAALTFSTVGAYTASNVATTTFAGSNATNGTTLSFENVSNCVISFANNTHCAPNTTSPNSLLSTLKVTVVGTGAPVPSNNIDIPFSINYSIVAPRQATRTIRGIVRRLASSNTIRILLNPPTNNTYTLMGTTMKVCQTFSTTTCPVFPYIEVTPSAPGTTDIPLFMTTTPVEAYRLKVISIGYGPNGARKQLEGIVQKNFFNDLSGPAAITMQGTGTGLVFSPGNSSVFEISGDNGVPSVGVGDQTGLNTVINGIPHNNNNIQPAPAIVTDLPDWMATPQALDALVSQLRQTAQNSGRYYLNPTTNLTNVGDYSTGTGITFCEGDCTAGVDGGGILVVTGQLRNVGGWDFKGLIIVTGAEGWLRNGAGGGTVSGNVVIAPYGPAQLASNTFSIPPKYEVTGAGTSTVEYDAVTLDDAFNGTDAISNFMLGVAEK